MFSWFSQPWWQKLLTFAGISLEYVIAAAMVAGGIYLVAIISTTNPFIRPLRWVGIALICGGVGLGLFTYGKTVGSARGSAACYREWNQKNYEAQLQKLKQETEAKQIAIDTANEETKKLEAENAKLQDMVADYMVATAKLPDCRHATDDDNKRVCKLTGNAAGGCSSPKRLRPSGKTSRLSIGG